MRIWKLLLRTAVVAGGCLGSRVAGAATRSAPSGGRKGGNAGSGAAGHAGAGHRRWSRGRSRSISTIRPAPRSIRSVTLQAKVSGYLQEQPAADGADVKAGDLLYQHRPARLSRRRSTRRKAQLQRDEAALDYAALQPRPRHRAGQERLSGQGHLRPAHQRGAAGRGRRSPWTEAAVRTAELNLGYTEIQAPFAGRARPQPGAGRHADAASPARRSTRWCSSTRSM